MPDVLREGRRSGSCSRAGSTASAAGDGGDAFEVGVFGARPTSFGDVGLDRAVHSWRAPEPLATAEVVMPDEEGEFVEVVQLQRGLTVAEKFKS